MLEDALPGPCPPAADDLPGAAELAHDIRSPLGSILLLADTLRREHSGPLQPLQRRQLEIIYSAALALSTFAEDVMDAANDASTLVESTSTPFSVRDTLAWLQDLLQPVASAKDLELRVQARGADLRLGYPLALQRVLLNLLTNALKFTEAGSVTLTVAAMSNGRLRFSVADTGRGMPIEVKRLICRLQDGDHPALKSGGRRLKAFGLTVCVKLLRQLGSHLVVNDVPGGGTVCSFALPLPVYDPRAQLPEAALTDPPGLT